MKRLVRTVPLLAAALVVFAALPARAQMATPEAKEPHGRVSLYRIAPGKQLDFLKWMAEQDAIAKEAGVPATQLYAHTDGDSWDYLGIAPDLTKEQEAKVDAVAKKRGKKTGFAASLEFRTFVASHTDTFAIGPVTAAELVAMAAK